MAISVILLPRGSYRLEDIRCWLCSRDLSIIAFEQSNCPDATSVKVSDLFIQLAQSSVPSQPVPIRGVSITFPATAPGNGFLVLVARPDFGRFSRPTVGKSLRTVVLSDLLGCVPGGRNPDVENDRKKILTTFVTA